MALNSQFQLSSDQCCTSRSEGCYPRLWVGWEKAMHSKSNAAKSTKSEQKQCPSCAENLKTFKLKFTNSYLNYNNLALKLTLSRKLLNNQWPGDCQYQCHALYVYLLWYSHQSVHNWFCTIVYICICPGLYV